jgi:hypothetical protein
MEDDLTTEQPLPGGRHVGGVRVGDTVRRRVQPWTPAVHGLLRHLEAAGFGGAPRVLGIDERGREVLSWLPGDTIGERRPWPDWAFGDDALVQVGAWLRRLHDVTAGYVPPAGASWLSGRPWQPGLVVGHHDASPVNAVWDGAGGRLVGFVDWDTAGPSSRELDLAFTALTWVPLHARAVMAACGFTAFDERPRRLRLLLDAYGHDGDRAAFGRAVAARARLNAQVIHRLGFDALLPVATDYDQAAREIDALPATFWT